MEIETPTINRYVRLNAREAAKAHREFREGYKLWLAAYRSHDVLKIEELAKKRDLKARKASMALHKADRFLMSLAGLWELKY